MNKAQPVGSVGQGQYARSAKPKASGRYRRSPPVRASSDEQSPADWAGELSDESQAGYTSGETGGI